MINTEIFNTKSWTLNTVANKYGNLSLKDDKGHIMVIGDNTDVQHVVVSFYASEDDMYDYHRRVSSILPTWKQLRRHVGTEITNYAREMYLKSWENQIQELGKRYSYVAFMELS